MPGRPVYYTIEIAPDVKGVPRDEFARKVAAVLGDPRGWRKYGYTFHEVASWRPGVLRLRLETGARAAELCGMEGFSCYRVGPGDIVFHLGNWMGGSRSELPLDRYRTYVVNHEVGHYLGLDHQACPIAECRRRGLTPCPASVMQQMTRGPAAIAPCAEADWPLDPSWGVDNPREGFQSGRASRAALLILAIIAVLLCGLAVAAAGRATSAGRAALRNQLEANVVGNL